MIKLGKAKQLTALMSAMLILSSFPAFAEPENAPRPPTPGLETQVRKTVGNLKHKNYLSLSYENDLIGSGRDSHYTSGVQATWFNVNTPVPPVIDELANMIPTFDLNPTTSTFFTIGQTMFTPEDISIRAPQPDDRPWAGFLYGSVGLATVTDNHIDELEVTLGIVGPEALGEQTQKFVHSHITSSQTPKGWSNQLDFEPGLILSAQRRWPMAWHHDFAHDFRLAVTPNVNLSLGNIYTYAGAGGMITLGPYQKTLQDTPPRVRPAMPGTGFFDVPDQGWSWYLFAGLDGRAIARNIFLNGNTFEDSPSVDKKYFVADATAGLAFTLDDYRLSYAFNYRTDEFDGQNDNSVFGSLTLTTRF